jgi:glutamine amidotransferase
MIAIIDYEAGNIGSIANALKGLGVKFAVTSDAQAIKSADGVIFPGQGRSGPAMASLKKTGLDKLLPALKQPFLGICLGMQLMVDELEEDNTRGLAIIPGRCMKFRQIKPVPHMGWNSLNIVKNSRLLDGVKNDSYMYFVHSYFVEAPDEFVAATTDYGGAFASVVAKDNFYGVQAHPEKSAETGESILKNFLNICGENL